MWRWSVSPENAPNTPTYIELTYRQGDIVAIDGKDMTPAQVLTYLNKVGGDNGIGRVDIVENRYVGMKARGCYETPGGTIISAPPSIKNESKSRDPEMRHAKNCHASREAPQALAKNTAQLYSLFALANLFLSKRFMPLAG